MNVKDWSSFYKREGKQELKQNILDTISLWGAMVFLWCSFFSIIGELFPAYLQAEIAVYQTSANPLSSMAPVVYKTIKVDVWIMFILTLVLWIGYDWPRKYGKWLSGCCRFLGFGIPVGYLILTWQNLKDGLIGLAWHYLPYVNAYYKQSFYLGLPENDGNAVIAFTCICMWLWLLVWLLAYGLKKRILLTLFPVAGLGLELAVGWAPAGVGLLYLFYGSILLTTLGGTSIWKKFVVLACAVLSVYASGICFEEEIDYLTTGTKKESILRLQNDFSWDRLRSVLGLDVHFDWENLNNKPPVYTGKKLFEVKVDHLPENSVYFKGYHATDYEQGNWKYDDQFFKESCKEIGISEEKAAQFLFDMAYTVLKESRPTIHYELKMTGAVGDVAYAPYFSAYESFDEVYTTMGDFLLKKGVWDKEIRVDALGGDLNLIKLSEKDESWWSDKVDREHFKNKGEMLDWYNGLAQAYLKVPESMKFITEEFNKATDNEFKFYHPGNEYYHYVRLIAYDIRNYLDNRMSYSLILDDLPKGADPMEYALTVSHEGYCMHFASIATLMFRTAEIPARYVSGYVVNSADFVETEDGYLAEVTDYDAHAWVEIYLKDIGWIPFEVTPGYHWSYTEKPTEKDIYELEEDAEQHRELFEEPESDGFEELESEETESEEITSEVTELEESTETTSEEAEQMPQMNMNDGDNGNYKRKNIVLQVILPLFIMVIIACFVCRVWSQQSQKTLRMQMEKGLTRKAIKHINRRIYLCLCSKKPGIWFTESKRLTDGDYEELLAKCFTDISREEWKRYMEIVKKNYYSCEKISIEEMQYCYECYRRLKKKV